jgi:hypothetical protein
MTIIEFKLYGDILVHGDISLFVKRSFLLNSNINLEFFFKDELILQTEFNTLNPTSKVKILYQNLQSSIGLAYNDKIFEWKNNWLTITHNWFHFISKRLCTVNYNGEKLLEVHRKNLKLNLTTENLDKELILNLVLFVIIHYSDIDGGE